ncbi:ImuA family protein [Rhodovulum sp. YNF3179]|uniref:ImuA family protein n=1 Tax=Rhodovulum sp. YNF3179 TaxID=3425127 RepID=UPI003D32CA8B
MDSALLTRGAPRPRPGMRFLDGPELAPGRVHEFCGPARRTLALMLARETSGPILWIRPAWAPDSLNPEGMVALVDPARLIEATPKRAEDLLWCMEETLRSGMIALAVVELPEPPGLTPVRRLHLAAETGAAEGHGTPTGVLLIPGAGGAPGVESRWHLAPRHAEDVSLWRLERRRARTAPPRAWTVERRGRRFAARDGAGAPAV